MNWHANGNVKFVASDPQKQDVELVEAKLPNGDSVTYRNVKSEMTDEQVAAADRQTMDCIDCHNRAGHPFKDPESVVDAAFASGDLNSALPYVKKYILELLNTDISSEDEARRLVEEAYARYQEQYPNVAEEYPEAYQQAMDFMEQRQDFMVDLMVRSQFIDSDEVTWKSFPDNLGHKTSPGCFRCHSGRLQNADGKPIPVNCSTCHSLPLVTKRDKIPEYYLALIDQKKPRNHRQPDWMAKHMGLADERCGACHGEKINFGTNDKTFCSNSGCHDETWKYLDLSALQQPE